MRQVCHANPIDGTHQFLPQYKVASNVEHSALINSELEALSMAMPESSKLMIRPDYAVLLHVPVNRGTADIQIFGGLRHTPSISI